MADRLLTPFIPSLSVSAREQLEELGVEVILGKRVTDVNEQGVRIDDEFVPASVVCWASGVRGESLAERLGVTLDRGDRIIVDQHCAVLGRANIFAIGDIAAFTPNGEQRALPGVAPVAIQQGRHVAKMIQNDLRRKPRTVFKYVDKGMMATIGRRRAVAQASWMPPLTGLMAWLVWSVVHVLYLVGFHNRAIVVFEWVWSYLTYARGARLITSRFEPKALPLASKG